MLGDKLRLVRRIGKGGMGTVWEAEHIGLGIRVAVKRLQRGLAYQDEFRRRLLREARSAARVKHPHVVEIFDVTCDDDGVPYLVMELLEGEPLGDVHRREGPLPWSRVRPLLEQLADALAAAHACGVVHRDIKPSNIIVSDWGSPAESVTLIDFGLAKQQSLDPETQDITHTGEIFGSPGYMSPEQLRSAAVDARTDVYALGCVAYELLTGRKPFGGPTVADLVVQHLTQAPPSPTPIEAEATEIPEIQALILRTLDKDPRRRHQSIAELTEELSRIGRRAAWWPRLVPRRRWSLAAVGGVLGATLLGGVLVTPEEPEPEPEGSSEREDSNAPFSHMLARPLDRPTPTWPTQWRGHELGLPEPMRDREPPSLTGFDVPDDQVGVWGADPRTEDPYRILVPRDEALALSKHVIAEGLTLGHPVDDPQRVEREGRGSAPTRGRVYWSESGEFPLSAVGSPRVGPGCTGVIVGPVHVLTAAQCVWEEGRLVFDDLRWQPGDARDDDRSAVEIIRVYVPPQWPQRDRSGLFDWAIVITERQIGDEYFGVTALDDHALARTPLHHKGYPLEHDRECEARSPVGWADGANRPWGNPEPLIVAEHALRGPSPSSGWDRVLATTQPCSSGHAGGPYYFYDASHRPVVAAIHRSACTSEDGGTAEFCGYAPPWSCGIESVHPSQAIRLEPFALYGHIVPVLSWWGTDESGRARCLLESGC